MADETLTPSVTSSVHSSDHRRANAIDDEWGLVLDCPWHHAWGPDGDGSACASSVGKLPTYHPFVPSESRTSIRFVGESKRGPDDAWLAVEVHDEAGFVIDLHRFNGVAWVRMAVLERGLEYVDHWADAAGHLWMLARRSQEDAAGAENETILRLEGHGLEAIEVPPSFAAQWVRRSGPNAVWFLGVEKAVYAWDGKAVREGEAPFAPRTAWAAPDGKLWIAGEGPNQLAHWLEGGRDETEIFDRARPAARHNIV